MSGDIWISSDWHLFHSNILTFIDYSGKKVRPEFSTVDEMNECILDSHNSVVKPGDIHYNLGDVFFGDKAEFEKIIRKFNGRKRLLVGNHDDPKYLSQFFQKIGLWRVFSEHGLILSHIPLHESSLYRSKDLTNPMLCVHGHIHSNESPPGPYKNVCVEKIGYTPVNIEELRVK